MTSTVHGLPGKVCMTACPHKACRGSEEALIAWQTGKHQQHLVRTKPHKVGTSVETLHIPARLCTLVTQAHPGEDDAEGTNAPAELNPSFSDVDNKQLQLTADEKKEAKIELTKSVSLASAAQCHEPHIQLFWTCKAAIGYMVTSE